MVDPRLYDAEAFVLLESNQPEQILTPEELSDRLQTILQTHQANLPDDVKQLDTVASQADYLIETLCELDLGPDQYLQWFAIRLEK